MVEEYGVLQEIATFEGIDFILTESLGGAAKQRMLVDPQAKTMTILEEIQIRVTAILGCAVLKDGCKKVIISTPEDKGENGHFAAGFTHADYGNTDAYSVIVAMTEMKIIVYPRSNKVWLNIFLLWSK